MSVLKFSFSMSSELSEGSAVSVMFDEEMSCAGQYADPHLAISASLRSVYTSVLPEERTGYRDL